VWAVVAEAEPWWRAYTAVASGPSGVQNLKTVAAGAVRGAGYHAGWYTATPESLVFLRRFPRLVAPNLKPDTKFTKIAKRTKNAEGHEEGRPYFVFFSMRVSASSRFDLPFFVAFVPFVLSRSVAATLR